MPRTSLPLSSRRRSLPALLLCATSLAIAPAALAVRAPDAALLPDLDVRASRGARLQAAVGLQAGVKPAQMLAGPVAEPGPVRLAALEALRREAGLIQISWDEITGSPRMLFARTGFLSPPDAREASIIAREFLLRHRGLFLLEEAAARALPVSAIVPAAAGGSIVRFEQAMAGLDVLHGHLAISLTADGRIVHVMGGGVSGAVPLAATTPVHDAAEALRALADMVGAPLKAMPAPVAADATSATFRAPELRGSARVQLVAFPTAGGPRLGWEAHLAVAGAAASYAVVVDDATLQPVRRAATTWFLDTRGRVFVNSPANSAFDLVRFADSQDFRRDQSPLGWADESMAPLVTIGNNTVVQDDIADDDEATPGATGQALGPAPFWAFDHPFTTGGDADAQASLTNLFYGINWSHDRFMDLGFDAASGNFQVENFGLGGLGGDPVLGDDMDGSGTNNANFSTLPDGFPSRMQMYIWDISGTRRSSSFETGIVIHEYVHGVSTRLVGGASDVSCLLGNQGGAMGEAWSDYYAASFLNDPVIAEWVSGDPAGIRMFRLDQNPATGKDYRNFCRYPNDRSPQFCEPHDNGEMWSGLLWLIRDAYISTYGPADGARRADLLITDALKLTPCNPTMLDARDALILADRLQTQGQMECVIKSIAASRWFGMNASSTGTGDATPVAGNQLWPECVDAGLLRFDRDGLETGAPRARYSCGDIVTISLVDGNYLPGPGGVEVVVYRAAIEVDRETLTPAAADGPGVFTASITTSGLPPVPGDGALQVQAGDEIEATYVDASPVGNVAVTRADIDCTPRLSVIRHRVANGSCDADAVPGYPDLPGFVDAGETADVFVEIGNAMAVQLTGSMQITTDRPDLITVLPTAPLDVTFPTAVGTSPASLTLRLKVVGSPTITPGDVANLEFRFDAAGYDNAVAAVTLPLSLGLDYVLESGLTFGFDVEGESAPVGPLWTTGRLDAVGTNQWTVVTCANTTPAGTKAFRNGPANCAGRYSDAQGDPWLASPPMMLFGPDTAAARVTAAQWQNDIDLGVIGFPPSVPLIVDADAVAVVLTNDPAVFDTSNPIAIATTALAMYIKVDFGGFSQDSNTVGFVLDSRPVAPGQLAGVDLSQPVHLAWYFLPDITFVQPPLDAQGEGYYLDDVQLTYERVRAVPQAAACVPTVAPYSHPVVTEPTIGSTCAGDRVTVDGSLSEAALCGPPADLEMRFLVGGAPVACAQADGVTPRVQDASGWGPDAICVDYPVDDTTYVVEVRCAATPTPTDAASVVVRVIDGLPVLSGSERAFCAGSGQTITIDAGGSSLVGCPGVAEFAFDDAAGPLDCDGDTFPDGFSETATCIVGPSDVPMDVTVHVQCSALPGCLLSETITIPAVALTADAVEVTTPPGGFYCTGAVATLDASGSVVTGCDGGQVEYRWTSDRGGDSGWSPVPTHDAVVSDDENWSVAVRCSLSTSCVSAPAGPISLLRRTGTFIFSYATQPADCAGDLFELRGGQQPGVRCAGTVEYRFLMDLSGTLVPVACTEDEAGTIPRTADVDGWGAGDTCWTPHVAGGANFVMEYRCSDDPTCLMQRSLPRMIAPRTGIPTGTNAGILRARKTAGCPAGGDVRLAWADSNFNPATFVVFRSDDPQIDLVADRLANADDVFYSDAGVACDGGGVPYRGVAVYFYLHLGRNSCTDQPIP